MVRQELDIDQTVGFHRVEHNLALDSGLSRLGEGFLSVDLRKDGLQVDPAVRDDVNLGVLFAQHDKVCHFQVF